MHRLVTRSGNPVAIPQTLKYLRKHDLVDVVVLGDENLDIACSIFGSDRSIDRIAAGACFRPAPAAAPAAIEMAGDQECEFVGQLEAVDQQGGDVLTLGEFDAACAHLVIGDNKVDVDAIGSGDIEKGSFLVLVADGTGLEAVSGKHLHGGRLSGQIGRHEQYL